MILARVEEERGQREGSIMPRLEGHLIIGRGQSEAAVTAELAQVLDKLERGTP